MNKIATLLPLALALVLAACSAPLLRTGDAPSTESTLQGWTRETLAPYLAEQVGKHPRFRGQPVLLVRLAGQDVQPEIDDLTRSIRTELHDALLQVPGITLPWQPGAPELRHHRRPRDVQCRRVREAPYYIGI